MTDFHSLINTTSECHSHNVVRVQKESQKDKKPKCKPKPTSAATTTTTESSWWWGNSGTVDKTVDKTGDTIDDTEDEDCITDEGSGYDEMITEEGSGHDFVPGADDEDFIFEEDSTSPTNQTQFSLQCIASPLKVYTTKVLDLCTSQKDQAEDLLNQISGD